jgi:two-component system, OmpR family, phosphate regulon sensor histidine kinase PhoR
MDWFVPVFITALLLAGGMYIMRKYLLPWRQLEGMVNDLAAGKRPDSFVFHGAARFTRVALSLEKLANEEFNLQAILSSMAEGVMVVDNDHVIRLVNSSFLKLFKITGNPLGQTVLAALREASVEEILRATSQAGEIQTRDISILGDTQGEAARHFTVSAVPIKKADGKMSGMVTVFHDISRLRQLEDIRREFVANVSHELRTPLSIFHGYVENLLDNPGMPRKELHAIFEILDKHSLRLNALLEDLLAIARLESRRVKLEIEDIDLVLFFQQFLKDWKPRAAKKKITPELDLQPGLPTLRADYFRLEQVMNNLLDNAIKYAPEDGRITIRAAVRDGWFEIQVEDNGIGIPAGDLPHVFERFYRVEKARSREKGGTGLGLSIVKHIMVLHGGSAEARSLVGKGTAIILRFPIA